MAPPLNFLSGGSGALVRKLMGFVLNPDNNRRNQTDIQQDKNWLEKTVKGIIKKTKKNPVALDNLERAITNRDSTTECVTLSRFVSVVSAKPALPYLLNLHYHTCQLSRIGRETHAIAPKKKCKCVRFLPQFPQFYIYYHWYINCPKTKSHALPHSWVGRSVHYLICCWIYAVGAMHALLILNTW